MSRRSGKPSEPCGTQTPDEAENRQDRQEICRNAGVARVSHAKLPAIPPTPPRQSAEVGLETGGWGGVRSTAFTTQGFSHVPAGHPSGAGGRALKKRLTGAVAGWTLFYGGLLQSVGAAQPRLAVQVNILAGFEQTTTETSCPAGIYAGPNRCVR